MPTPPLATLGISVFTAPEKAIVGERPYPFGPPPSWDPLTSTLIYGEHDAVLIDALTTAAEASVLADWVALHHRNLTTIYITHGHFDHFLGLGVLLERFPQATAIATPQAVELMQAQLTGDWFKFANQILPGQLPAKRVTAQPFDGDVFTLEDHELHIIRQGRTDTVHTTSVHVPTLGLVVAGDVVYNQCHMFVGDTTPESRANWISALDGLTALNPRMVVAGHKKTGAPDSPDAITASKNYLIDFGRLLEAGGTKQQIYDEMTALYPDWVSHQAWLMFNFPALKNGHG